MIVARQVLNEKGTVLVSENTELTGKLIVRLENMNIGKVAVRGCPVDLAGFVPRPLKEKLRHFETAFSRMDPNDELMRKFRVLVKAHFINKDREQRDLNSDGSAAAASPGAAPAAEGGAAS